MSAEIDVAVSIEDEAWTRALPGVEELCRSMVLATVQAAGGELDGPAVEVSVVLTSDTAVHALNQDWRGQDKPTNVLSFAALDDDEAPVVVGAPVLLGDVVMAFGVCAQEARDQGKTLAHHTAHLVVHGTLHLLGWDHEEDETEAEEMERLETVILSGFGIADPYAEGENQGS
ncbi:MAG: Endoribonuclease [Rhodospirillaceae bacterium]|nr:MAG: Endoribonuclease [Rhodospirillaceae bacterium]TNC95937.1 MAG: Endoribonuclease YbeY [Stygiobacter sp.]